MLRYYYDLTLELTKREFSSRYQGSLGGIVWSFIQPLFLLAIYTLAFGVILKARWSFSENTTEYAFMLFAGLIVFHAFAECLSRSVTLITSNPNYVKKIVFPLELLPIVTVITAFVHLLIGTGIWIFGYSLLFGKPHLTVFLTPLILGCFLPVLLGISWLFAAMGVVIKDSHQMVGILNHTLLFLTPVFYSVDAAPPMIQRFLMLNPLTFIIEQFRLILFYGQMPAMRGLAAYGVLATIFASLSFLVFKRLQLFFADAV